MTRERLTDEQFGEEFARLAAVAGDGESCPPPEKLRLSGRAELDPEENEAIILHIGECTACAVAWRIARDMAPAAKTVSMPAARTRSTPSRWMPLLAAAAVVVVAAGLGIYLLGPDRVSEPVVRTQERDWLVSKLDESVPLPRENAVLRWAEGPEDTVFDIVVTDHAADTLSRGFDLDRPEFTIPVEELETIDPGGEIFWQVTARLLDGRELRSETFIAKIE